MHTRPSGLYRYVRASARGPGGRWSASGGPGRSGRGDGPHIRHAHGLPDRVRARSKLRLCHADHPPRMLPCFVMLAAWCMCRPRGPGPAASPRATAEPPAGIYRGVIPLLREVDRPRDRWLPTQRSGPMEPELKTRQRGRLSTVGAPHWLADEPPRSAAGRYTSAAGTNMTTKTGWTRNFSIDLVHTCYITPPTCLGRLGEVRKGSRNAFKGPRTGPCNPREYCCE